MVQTRTSVGVWALLAGLAAGATGVAAQGFIVIGADAGVGYRTAGSEFETLVETYNQVNDSLLARPLADAGGIGSLAWNVRLNAAALPIVFGASLGLGGYEAETDAEFEDGSARSFRIEVSDFVAGLDLGWGGIAGRSLFYAGPTLMTRVRETTVTGVRRFSDGSSDGGDPSPVSALSGEFTGSLAQFSAGGVIGAQALMGSSVVLTLRASAVFPVGEYSISLTPHLERGNGGLFPVDLERFGEEGNTVTEANAMRSGMKAIEFELTVGIGFGARL